MTTRHPEGTELADFIDGAADEVTTARVSAHLEVCAVCAAIVAGAGEEPIGADAPDLATLQQSLTAVLVPDLWRRALDELVVHSPAAGQVWRLRVPDPFGEGPELTDVVALVSAGDDLLAAPVTVDSQETTDLWTVQLPVTGTDMWVAVWVSLAQPVGYEALDVHLGDVDAEPILALHRALRRGQRPPAGLPTGGPVSEELRSYRDQLRSRLALIGEMRLTDLLATQQANSGDVDVVDAIESRGWGLRQLGEVAGLTARDAHAVMARQMTLTDEQREAVGRALGVSTSAGLVPLPDPGLVAAVTTPHRRHRFGAVAAHDGVDPWSFRAEQLALRPAARKAGATDADWDALVEQHLMRLEITAGLREG